MNPYLSLVEFMLTHISPKAILDFRVSEGVHNHAYGLLDKEKAGTATPDEIKQINEFMTIEHIMRLAKAKANQYDRQ